MKNVSKYIILAVLIFAVAFSALSCEKPEDGPEYQVGNIINQGDIENRFELIGERTTTTYWGAKRTLFVRMQQTSDLGWVAWTDYKYVYTPENIGKDEMNKLVMSHLLDMEYLGEWNLG